MEINKLKIKNKTGENYKNEIFSTCTYCSHFWIIHLFYGLGNYQQEVCIFIFHAILPFSKNYKDLAQ